MYCIGFNGPPRSGKDTLSFLIQKRFDDEVLATWVRSLSMPMRRVAFAMLDKPYSFELYEELKDERHEVFGGKTLREFMILYSESFAKPTFGDEVWAKSLMSGLDGRVNLPGLCLIPDIGFQPETNYLVDQFGKENFLLIRLSRRNTSFERDSRNYVTAPEWAEVYNAETQVSETADVILDIAKDLGWKL